MPLHELCSFLFKTLDNTLFERVTLLFNRIKLIFVKILRAIYFCFDFVKTVARFCEILISTCFVRNLKVTETDVLIKTFPILRFLS